MREREKGNERKMREREIKVMREREKGNERKR